MILHRFFVALTSLLYRYIVKPLLFLMPPDRVHAGMLRFSYAFGSWRWSRWLAKRLFTRSYPQLHQQYHGISFPNPIGVGAGFDKNADTVPVVATLGFGFTTVGSVTADVCDGNPRPWFYRLPKTKSLVVHVGLANNGSTSVITRLEDYKGKIPPRFPVALSVAKTNSPNVVSDEAGIADYVTSIKRAAVSPSVTMIEINISCPNTYGGEPFTSPKRLDNLLKAVDAVNAPQPVFVKMPSDLPWQTFKQLLDSIVKHRVAGVTIANLVKHREYLRDPLPKTVKGNLSGKPTWDISNKLIARTYAVYGDRLTIIGLGGVFTAKDAYTKIRLGASLVELVTGLIFRGPQLAAEINSGLVKLLEQDGFRNVSEAIGVDVERQHSATGPKPPMQL